MPIWCDLEKFVFACTNAQHFLAWNADHLDYAGHLVDLAFTGEKRIADVKFSHNTPERPHVDSTIVGYTKHDLRRAVKPRLDVGVDSFVQEGTTSKVYDFDATFIWLLQQDVFWF